ncbi:pyridoxamine 5'-phosphate oxidase family protein [Streptomyces sp. TRM66268-LWL]|uniref:Pyridoxamine 5'-phosphate oxidase family protein n=1 Tax=Streptomyces polyasparticus TaxID=2767826 RepID=A0ABR7SFL0_9ACTN|nr:pyridoxamine 5'-phosphate oxidase family protein [Streptomyces polyasparticus]MBC9714286.1 pyridoxamine 5'-phosphate oxidase family protein [Streptomyces polyasparticus]
MSTDENRALDLLSHVPHGRVATSMRALPFLALARHIVVDGTLLLRMHKGFGYHQACIGSVVAYGADNLNSGADGLWSVQLVGLCEAIEPSVEELELFGPAPHFVDGALFEPVYMRIQPQVVTVHSMNGAYTRQLQQVL